MIDQDEPCAGNYVITSELCVDCGKAADEHMDETLAEFVTEQTAGAAKIACEGNGLPLETFTALAQHVLDRLVGYRSQRGVTGQDLHYLARILQSAAVTRPTFVPKTLTGRVTGFDGRYLRIECDHAPTHLRTLNLTRGQSNGAAVGDRVRLAYVVTSGSALWNVAAIL